MGQTLQISTDHTFKYFYLLPSMPLLCILGVDRASGLPVTIAWAIVSNKGAALVAASLEIVARAARRASGLEHLHVRVGTHDLVPADGEAMRKVFARIVYLVRCLFHVRAALMPLARAAWRADAGAGASIGEFVALWALVMAMYQATNRNNMIMIAIGLAQSSIKRFPKFWRAITMGHYNDLGVLARCYAHSVLGGFGGVSIIEGAGQMSLRVVQSWRGKGRSAATPAGRATLANAVGAVALTVEQLRLVHDEHEARAAAIATRLRHQQRFHDTISAGLASGAIGAASSAPVPRAALSAPPTASWRHSAFVAEPADAAPEESITVESATALDGIATGTLQFVTPAVRSAVVNALLNSGASTGAHDHVVSLVRGAGASVVVDLNHPLFLADIGQAVQRPGFSAAAPGSAARATAAVQKTLLALSVAPGASASAASSSRAAAGAASAPSGVRSVRPLLAQVHAARIAAERVSEGTHAVAEVRALGQQVPPSPVLNVEQRTREARADAGVPMEMTPPLAPSPRVVRERAAPERPKVPDYRYQFVVGGKEGSSRAVSLCHASPDTPGADADGLVSAALTPEEEARVARAMALPSWRSKVLGSANPRLQPVFNDAPAAGRPAAVLPGERFKRQTAAEVMAHQFVSDAAAAAQGAARARLSVAAAAASAPAHTRRGSAAGASADGATAAFLSTGGGASTSSSASAAGAGEEALDAEDEAGDAAAGSRSDVVIAMQAEKYRHERAQGARRVVLTVAASELARLARLEEGAGRGATAAAAGILRR